MENANFNISANVEQKITPAESHSGWIVIEEPNPLCGMLTTLNESLDNKQPSEQMNKNLINREASSVARVRLHYKFGEKC